MPLFSLLQMGANSFRTTPLKCILKSWDRFDPQNFKKTHLIFFCDTEMATVSFRRREMLASWKVSINTVLQLDQFCRKQGKWVEVT